MRPGSVIVDLAVERGGNVEGAVAGKIVEVNEIKIVGHLNVAGRIAATASQLYAKNLVAFFETLVDKDTKTVKINFDDELVKATVLTHGGKWFIQISPAPHRHLLLPRPSLLPKRLQQPKFQLRRTLRQKQKPRRRLPRKLQRRKLHPRLKERRDG